MIIEVPNEFKIRENSIYPEHNDPNFEQWYYNNYHEHKGRIYLPILWTAYLKYHNYGQDIYVLSRLQKFIDTLPTDVPMYTICQWDDGCKVDISKHDIKVFYMGYPAKDEHIQIPLLCQPHPYKFNNKERDIFCSFIGSRTHVIRNVILDHKWSEGFYITDKPHTTEQYCEIMARSKYVLGPRGYGFSSFRIAEALQYGAIPVVVTDHLVPYEYNYAHVIPLDLFISFGGAEQHEKVVLRLAQGIVKDNLLNDSDYYERYFTFGVNKDAIIKYLENEYTS